MRKPLLLLCSLAFGLSGCAPATNDPEFRSREERPYPNPTLGTENPESQWYRTQTIAPPSPAAAPASDAPARVLKKPVPTRPATPRPTPTGTLPTANPTQ